jgi:predicted DNA-binding protein
LFALVKQKSQWQFQKFRVQINVSFNLICLMTRIPRTLNIGPEEKAALENLSKMEGRPVNELLNEAVKHYLGWRGGEMRDSEATLSALRAYQKQDPRFRKRLMNLLRPKRSQMTLLRVGLRKNNSDQCSGKSGTF